MAGHVDIRTAIDGVQDGVPWTAPGLSVVSSIKRFASVTAWRSHRRIILPAWTGSPLPDPTLLFDAADNGYAFQWVAFALVGGHGFAHLAMLADKPVSSSDLSPAGTHERVAQIDLTCTCPLVINTPLARVHPTLATAAGMSGGYPHILWDVGTVEGRWYRAWARNQSTTTPIQVDVWAGN